MNDFEYYHLDILGVTETCLKVARVDHLDNGPVMYRSGGSASRAGVAVILHKRISNNVISYNFISERTVSVRLRSSPWRGSRCLTVVCYYALTLHCSLTNPNLADEFYSQLEHVINQVKRRDELFVLGDLNAKVGSSSPDYSSVVGIFPNTDTTMPLVNAL